MRFVDLFAGLGGFHVALQSLDHDCVFASELDSELRGLYAENFPDSVGRIHGDIRESKHLIPAHDILCAGFPCQPFSKSGSQDGVRDKTRGTLFHEILEVIETRRPRFVILENVGNFERHDDGRTWRIAKGSLQSLGYSVQATEHIGTGGGGLISPHHFGFPHSRERFFAVGSRDGAQTLLLRRPDQVSASDIRLILENDADLSEESMAETTLSPLHRRCIEHWNTFLRAIPSNSELPSFPIWGDEFRATYPYRDYSPSVASKDELLSATRRLGGRPSMTRAQLVRLLPSYAQDYEGQFPRWKIRFISQNRKWLRSVRKYLPRDWVDELQVFPPSLRKLEWNCQGETRDLWEHVLQFRPSGLRVKRMTSIPALVSLNTTQVPIIGPKRRFITRVEARRLQGFPETFRLPATRNGAFRALGNAVHVEVATIIARAMLASPNSAAATNATTGGDGLTLELVS